MCRSRGCGSAGRRLTWQLYAWPVYCLPARKGSFATRQRANRKEDLTCDRAARSDDTAVSRHSRMMVCCLLLLLWFNGRPQSDKRSKCLSDVPGMEVSMSYGLCFSPSSHPDAVRTKYCLQIRSSGSDSHSDRNVFKNLPSTCLLSSSGELSRVQIAFRHQV